MSEMDQARQLQNLMTTLATIYNCHPYEERRVDWNGKVLRVRPLGSLTIQKAAVERAMGRDRSEWSEKRARGWLTDDPKVFEACRKQHEDTERVMNIMDEDVCATTKGGKNLTFVVPPDKLEQMKEAQIRAIVEDDAAADVTDKRAKPKPKTPVEVSVG